MINPFLTDIKLKESEQEYNVFYEIGKVHLTFPIAENRFKNTSNLVKQNQDYIKLNELFCMLNAFYLFPM